MNADIMISQQGCAGRITLNRPKALHALTQSMCEQITEALLDWATDGSIEFIMLDHAPGSRGFCAGGDVTMLAASGKSDARKAFEFFKTEYRLNDLISRYPKPYIAFMDGVTMGGGVGLSIHGTYQVATERTVFAMPETGIGLFPDVGSTWFLPRLNGEIGTWLALTGARLKGCDVAAVGLASHFCLSEDLAELKDSLTRSGLEALKPFRYKYECTFKERFQEIDTLFSGSCAAQLVGRLEKGSIWAKQQATKLAAKSPLSTKIALRQMRTGEFLEQLSDALRIEYRIATRLVRSPEFHEGVRAVLLDKDHLPNWRSATIRATTYDMVSQYFSPLCPERELSFLEI